MPRVLTIATALRNAGLNVIEYPGWQTRGAADFDPQAVMIHHTAGPTRGDAPSLMVCVNGRPDLPGPLCHVVLARSGKCHLIAAGRANHAGAGRWKGVTGNRRFFGIEAENTGRGEPWPVVQMDAFVRCAAALCRLTGNPDPGMVVCHREYAPGRKIDPTGVDGAAFRNLVARTLSHAPHQEDDLDMTRDELKDAVKEVLLDVLRAPEFQAAAVKDTVKNVAATVGATSPIK